VSRGRPLRAPDLVCEGGGDAELDKDMESLKSIIKFLEQSVDEMMGICC
jgi:hypothetical protein